MTDVPNWWPKLMRAARASDLSLNGAVALADVRHDDICARLQGIGVCDCEPDVTLMQRSGEER